MYLLCVRGTYCCTSEKADGSLSLAGASCDGVEVIDDESKPASQDIARRVVRNLTLNLPRLVSCSRSGGLMPPIKLLYRRVEKRFLISRSQLMISQQTWVRPKGYCKLRGASDP